MGLSADAQVPCFLLVIWTIYRDKELRAIYRDLLPSSNFTVTPAFQPSTGTGKKQVTATLTATH
jgi:hypothetical protein